MICHDNVGARTRQELDLRRGMLARNKIQNPNNEIKQVRNIKRKTKARISGFETLEFCNSTLFRASDFVLRILLWSFAASFS